MGETSFSIPLLQDHPFWGTQGGAASRACCSPAFKPHWIHMLPMSRVIFPLVSAWPWLVAISSIQPWPYALGYQQEQERKDSNLQGAVSIIIPAATTTGQGWGLSSSPVETLLFCDMTFSTQICHTPPRLEIVFWAIKSPSTISSNMSHRKMSGRPFLLWKYSNKVGV